MGQGSDLRSAPIDKTTKQGSLGIVVADSGFITGYATPSSTIEIKKNGQKILTSKLDDTGSFKLNAPGIKVGDRVELVVNGQSVYNTTGVSNLFLKNEITNAGGISSILNAWFSVSGFFVFKQEFNINSFCSKDSCLDTILIRLIA